MPDSQESPSPQNEQERSGSRSDPSVIDRKPDHPTTQERSELVHLGQEMPLLRGEKAIITSLPVPQPYDLKGLARGMAERPETKVLSVLELDPQEIAPALGMMVINETGQIVPVSFLPKGRVSLHYQREDLDHKGELEWYQFDLIPEYLGDPRVEEFNKSPNIEGAWLEVKGQSGDSYKVGFTSVFRGREKSVTGIRYKMEKIEKKAKEEKKEETKKPEERGEVRIKSGIKGLTWSLASSSGDTADYDTNPDNLIYEYTSETNADAAKEKAEIPAQTKEDETKVIESVGVKEIKLDSKVHIDCTEKPRIIIGGNITDSSYYELSPNGHDAAWLNVRGARYLEPAVLALSVEGPSVIPHPLSDRRVVFHYRDRLNKGHWKSMTVINSTNAKYDVQQKEIAQITSELNPENFWFDVAPSNRSNGVTGYEVRFTDFSFGEGETKITGLDLVVNEGSRTRVR